MTASRPITHRPTAPGHLPLRFGMFRPAVLAALLRETREARALSRDALAALAGLSVRDVVDIEAGTASPSVETLLALTDALWVDTPTSSTTHVVPRS